jgi:hypothetical protein
MAQSPVCRRCGRSVVRSVRDYDTFEQMHYVCFHYEFEHDPSDVDDECMAGGCPSARPDLRATLGAWTDWDLAAFRLGRALGAIAEPDRSEVTASYWVDHPFAPALHDALTALANLGLIERRENGAVQFRWPAASA